MKSFRSTAQAALGLVMGIAAIPAIAGPSILVDGNTGVVLSSENASQHWYPASLTKLMTTYVAFRAIEAGEVTLDSPVRISVEATKEQPSKMGYPAGTIITLGNAIKIIMVKSANDVATAIGESLAGSTAAFAARMNAEAQRIGMTGSHFVNAHGWHSPDQYSTAHDFAMLALRLKRDYPQYASVFDIEALTDGKKVLPNHNDMIFRFAGADGMKTGYTCDAGYNLVASATRNGRMMIAVVLGAKSVGDRTDLAADLLAKGFEAPPRTGDKLASLPVTGPVEATNMREAVCSKEARKELLASLDEKGRIIFKSAHVTGGDLPAPKPEPIFVGGATGPASPFFPEVKRPESINGIPIPVPRPERPSDTAASASAKPAGVTQ